MKGMGVEGMGSGVLVVVFVDMLSFFCLYTALWYIPRSNKDHLPCCYYSALI
jgi:hypothetical protein